MPFTQFLSNIQEAAASELCSGFYYSVTAMVSGKMLDELS